MVSRKKTGAYRLHHGMTFSESDVNRDRAGKFSEKIGSPANIGLSSPQPSDEPLPDISDFNPRATPAQQNIRQVADLLGREALDEEGVTLDDIATLRRSMERAEFRLTEYEIEDYLEKNYPEVKGVFIESDGWEHPRFVGVELEDNTAPDTRNWQKAAPLEGRYADLRNHLNNKYGGAIQDFRDRASFDEYGEVLYDDEDQYGRFTGLNGFLSSDDIPVYRIAQRD